MTPSNILGEERKALLEKDFDRFLAAYLVFRSRAIELGVSKKFWVSEGVKQEELVSLFKGWYSTRGVLIYGGLTTQKSTLIL